MRKFIRGLVPPMLALSAAAANGQPPKHISPPRIQTMKEASTGSQSLLTFLELSGGAGQYPILEMPVLSQGTVRADGSNSEADLKVNRGVLLNLNLGGSIPTDIAKYSVKLGIQRIATAPGGGIPTPSSYVRLSAEAGAGFDLWNNSLLLTPAIEARRSMYRNVETGHYIDALLVKAETEKKLSDETAFSVCLGYAPLAQFGLLQNSNIGKSGALADSQSSLSEIGARLTWIPDKATSFHIALNQESAIAKLKSSEGYKAYGLPVAPFSEREPNRVYNLTTRQIAIGTVKRF